MLLERVGRKRGNSFFSSEVVVHYTEKRPIEIVYSGVPQIRKHHVSYLSGRYYNLVELPPKSCRYKVVVPITSVEQKLDGEPPTFLGSLAFTTASEHLQDVLPYTFTGGYWKTHPWQAPRISYQTMHTNR
jgi:hypothetical protein